jgi:hypothetical protein
MQKYINLGAKENNALFVRKRGETGRRSEVEKKFE